MTMTDAERDTRMRELLSEEATQPRSWWWLSFAGESGFLGVAIVQGQGILTAVLESRRLGCNPGGEVVAWTMTEDELPDPDRRERLLSFDELAAMTPHLGGAAA